MPYYSNEVIEQVRAANDIVEVISSYLKLERRGHRYFGLCPFHNEKTGSFCVNSDNQLYHCFGCHESGTVITFLMKYESMEFPEALEALAQRAGIEIKSEVYSGNSQDFRKKRDDLFAANKAAAEFYYYKLRSPEGSIGMEYFKNRGLSPKTLNSFGLGYSGRGRDELYLDLKEKGFSDEILKEAGLIIFDEKQGIRDRFFNRVMFPIMDVNRHVIAFGARVMGDGQPKYLNSQESPIFNKSKTLYGLFAARRSRRREFILTEGYMDVISSHMAGFDNAIATLGTALTEEHAVILSRLKRPVFLCYDSDGAGKNAAKRAYEILKNAGISSKIMDLSPYKDPDELIKDKGPQEFENRINNAKNTLLTIMKWEYENIDPNDPDAVTGFTHMVAEKIASYKDEAARENYINSSCGMFSIEKSVLRRLVNGIGEANYDKESLPTPIIRRRGRQGPDKDKALFNAEGALLFYLTDVTFFDKVKNLVEREDFLDEDFKEVFDNINEKLREKNTYNPADLVNEIKNEEKQKLFSGIIFELNEGDLSEAEKLKQKKNVLLRVKRASIKRINSGIDPGDTKGLQQALEFAKETIEEIENLK